MNKITMLISAGLLTVLTLSAQEFAINGDFKQIDPNTKLPAGWYAKKGSDKFFKIITADGKNCIQILPHKSNVVLCTTKTFPVKPGDSYEVTIKAKGFAKFVGAGVILFEKDKEVESLIPAIKINSPDNFSEIKRTIYINNNPLHDITAMSISIGCWGNEEPVTVKGITFRKNKPAAPSPIKK